MTAREILVSARERIEDPSDWGQGEVPGRMLRSGDCAFTAVWTMRSASESWIGSAMDVALSALYEEITGEIPTRSVSKIKTITCFNDTHSHAEVLDLFDRALGRVEERELVTA